MLKKALACLLLLISTAAIAGDFTIPGSKASRLTYSPCQRYGDTIQCKLPGITVLNMSTVSSGTIDGWQPVFNFTLPTVENFPALKFYSAKDSAFGPWFIAQHDDPSADANDAPWGVAVYGGASDTVLGQFGLYLTDPTGASEDANWNIDAKVAGTLATRMRVGEGVIIGTGTSFPGVNRLLLPTNSGDPPNGSDTFSIRTSGSFGGGIGLTDGTFDAGLWTTTTGTSRLVVGTGTSGGAQTQQFAVGDGVIVGTGTTTPGAGNIALGTNNEITGTTSVGIDVGGTDEWDFTATALTPLTDAANDIGTSTVGIKDLHIASGGVINWDGSDVTLTHSANLMTLSGGTLVLGGLVGGHTGLLNTFNSTSDAPDWQRIGTSEDGTGIGLAAFRGTSGGGQFRFARSRGATVADYTATTAEDTLGQLVWDASDGADFGVAAGITGKVDGTVADAADTSDTPGRLEFGTSPDGASALTTRMTIKADGGVIIGPGTTSPTINEGGIRLYNDNDAVNGAGIEMHHDDPSADANDIPSNIKTYGGADDEAIAQLQVKILDPATTTEDTMFVHINRVAGADTIPFGVGGGSGDCDTAAAVSCAANTLFIVDQNADLQIRESEASGDNFKAFDAGATITADTTCVFENDANFIPDSCVGDGTDASDGRLKDVTGKADPKAVGAMLDRIQIYDYVWNADSVMSEDVRKGKHGFGPVAQELEKINPDWVHVGGLDPVTEPWEWKPEKLVPYLIAETQSLRKRVAELEGSRVVKHANMTAYDSHCVGIKLASGCIGWSY